MSHGCNICTTLHIMNNVQKPCWLMISSGLMNWQYLLSKQGSDHTTNQHNVKPTMVSQPHDGER